MLSKFEEKSKMKEIVATEWKSRCDWYNLYLLSNILERISF